MADEMTENAPQESAGRSGSSFTKVVIFLIVIAILAVGGYFLYQRMTPAVAIVNGEKVSQSRYDEYYKQLESTLTSQGVSATSTQAVAYLKQQTIDNIVTETLLLQKASAEGVSVNADAVNTQIKSDQAQFKDTAAFDSALSDRGYTEATYRDALTRQNIIQQYLNKHLDLASATATVAEINALYKQAQAANKNIPPLAQVRDQAAAQIVQQKQQQMILTYVQALRASSTVDIILK